MANQCNGKNGYSIAPPTNGSNGFTMLFGSTPMAIITNNFSSANEYFYIAKNYCISLSTKFSSFKYFNGVQIVMLGDEPGYCDSVFSSQDNCRVLLL